MSRRLRPQTLLAQAEKAKLAGKAQRCIERAERCWALIAGGEDRALQAACQRMLGMGHHHAGEPARALAAMYRAAELYEALDDRHSLARVLSVAACELASVGSTTEAMTTIERAVELGTRLADAHTEVCVWNNLGVVYDTLEDYPKAIAAVRTALTKAAGIDHPHTQMSLRTRLLVYQLEHGAQALRRGPDAAAARELGKALAEVEPQLQAGRAAGFDHMVTSISLAAGAALLALGRHDDAAAMLAAALKIARADGQLADAADIGLLLGITERAAGRSRRGLAAMRRALALAERLGQRDLCARCHLEISRSLEQLGELEAAFAHYRQHHQAQVDSLRVKADARVQILAIKLDIERSRLEAEVLRLRAAELERDKLDLQQHAQELSRHAFEDGLTGLANRRGFDRHLGALRARQGELPPLVLAMGDIDHFKRVNDGHSHAVGDAVLREVGLLLRGCFRPRDIVARFGGEEFVVAIVGATRAQARHAAERLRAGVEAHDWTRLAAGLQVTISIGLAQLRTDEAVDQALQRADAALYAAKRGGRNRVCDGDEA